MARRNNMSQPKLTAYLEQIVGSNRGKKTPLYEFDIIIGRSKSAHVCSQDPNVSRKHCSLKYTETGWSIKDLGSVNGTYIDDTRIPAHTYVPLNDGCAIYFGPSEDAPEGYRFESVKSPNEIPPGNELLRRSSRSRVPTLQKAGDSKAVKRKASPSRNTLTRSNERKCTVGVSGSGNLISSKTNEENYAEDDYHTDSSISSLDSLKTRIRKANSSQKKKEKRARYCNGDENLAVPSTSTEDDQLSEIGPSFETMGYQLVGEVMQNGKLVCLPMHEIRRLAADPNSEMSQSLLKEHNSINWNIDYGDSKSDCKKPDVKCISPVKKFNNSGDSSSVAVHSNLLKVLQKKVNDLQKTLKTLNLKFSDTMNENAKLVELLKSKERAELNMKEDFKKLLEDELICNICTELFIKPITLGCSHTFCQHCIFEWKKKKKQCPMCREKIDSETTVLFMDNFINKAVEQLDPASLEKRLDLLKKREESQKKKPKRKKAKSHNRRHTSVPDRDIPEVIEDDEVELLRSRISEIQSYTDDIQTYVDVIDELINERYSDNDEVSDYYPGYGRCYNCGRSGHWANGCPF